MPKGDPCSIDNCERPSRTRGWCATHYSRFLKYGAPEKVAVRKRSKCAVPDCVNPTRARGICGKHYQQWKSGRLDHADELGLPFVAKQCSVDGCVKPERSRGMCMNHYAKWSKYGDPMADGVKIRSDALRAAWKTCAAEGCERLAMSQKKDWCEGHWLRVKNHGDPLAHMQLGRFHYIPRPPGMEWCTTCKSFLPVTSFGSDASRRSGLATSCRQCSKMSSYRYQYRKSSAPGFATPSQIRDRWSYYGGMCWMCGDEADTNDHVKPLSKGGSNWPSNIRPACRSCNSRKTDKWPLAWDDLPSFGRSSTLTTREVA